MTQLTGFGLAQRASAGSAIYTSLSPLSLFLSLPLLFVYKHCIINSRLLEVDGQWREGKTELTGYQCIY